MSWIEEAAETFTGENEDGEGESDSDANADGDGDSGVDDGDDAEVWLLLHLDLRKFMNSISMVGSGSSVPLKLLSRLRKNLQ